MSDPIQIVRRVRVEHESGAWAEINASRSRAVSQALNQNTYWRDLAPLMAPLVLDWGRHDGPLIVETAFKEEADAILADDGETELVPKRTVVRVVDKELPPPKEDESSILILSDADPDLCGWLFLQVLLAPATLIQNEKKLAGPPSEPSADGTPDSAETSPTPSTTTTPKARGHRARGSSSKAAPSISA